MRWPSAPTPRARLSAVLLAAALLGGGARASATDVRMLQAEWRVGGASPVGPFAVERAAAFVRAHGVSVDELLEPLRAPAERADAQVWYLPLLVAPRPAADAFVAWIGSVDWARDGDELTRVADNLVVGDELVGGVALSGALLRRLDALPPLAPETRALALRLIVACPPAGGLARLVDEARSLDSPRQVAAIRAIGRLGTPDALAALRALWPRFHDRSDGLVAVADAIGGFGDDGVAILRELASTRGERLGPVLDGLAQARSPAAVAVARALVADDDAQWQYDRLRVEVAAGEPSASEGLLRALAGDDDDLRSLALALASEPISRARSAVMAAALGDGAAATAAREALERWRDADLEASGARSPLVGGLELVARQACVRDGDDLVLCVGIQIRNRRGAPVLLAMGPTAWLVETASPGVMLPPATRDPPSAVAVGERRDMSLTVALDEAAVAAARPCVGLVLTATAAEYPDLVGWTGRIVIPPQPLALPPRPDPEPDAWRARLAALAAGGSPPDGWTVAWTQPAAENGEQPAEERSLTIAGTRLVADRGIWLALPDDLLALSPDEQRDLAATLAGGDLFASAVVPLEANQLLDDPPPARLTIAAEGRCFSREGLTFAEPAASTLAALRQRLLAPRVAAARARLAPPR